jgi:glycosyltransferase involved in cell wall biosynthesis
MRREKSGLAFTTLELVKAEEQAGHTVCLREPTTDKGMPGRLLYGHDAPSDVEFIHSQMPLTSYFNGVPKFLWMHGEPLSSVGNGVSMKAIVDMAPKVDAFLAMRPEEARVWNSIKRTYIVPKGLDLERFHPMPVPPYDPQDPTSHLEGSPAILYCEHWRGQRNPLYWCVAMQQVWTALPDAKLHLFNCTDQKMLDTFRALIARNKWWAFVRSLKGPVPDDQINALYNRADIVVSGLYPLYARSIEAFGAGKAFIGPGYTDTAYPWHCTLDPDSMAQAVLTCWANYDLVDYRFWAEQKHDVKHTVAAVMQVVERYQ